MKIIKVSKQGCVPCQFVSNLLNDKGVPYEEVDAVANEEVRVKYDIHSVPVLLLVDENGSVVDKVNGYDPEAIEQLISQL